MFIASKVVDFESQAIHSKEGVEGIGFSGDAGKPSGQVGLCRES